MSLFASRFNTSELPLAYFITFRCYGTWLHGDERGSVDRYHNRYTTPFIPNNEPWRSYNQQLMKNNHVKLDAAQRDAVEAAIRETCEIRGWLLLAVNVRTNHVHTVISAGCNPEKVLSDLKAYATRRMKETGCWKQRHSPWSSCGSKRYLWTERSVIRAIDYVINSQGDRLPGMNEDNG